MSEERVLNRQTTSERDILIDRTLTSYRNFLEKRSPDTLDQLDQFVVGEVYLSDPFNSVNGVDRIKKTWKRLYDVCGDIKLTISHIAFAEGVAFISWQHKYRAQGAKANDPSQQIVINGVTELHFDGAGRIKRMIDHWDATHHFFEKLPIVGNMIKFFRTRMRA